MTSGRDVRTTFFHSFRAFSLPRRAILQTIGDPRPKIIIATQQKLFEITWELLCHYVVDACPQHERRAKMRFMKRTLTFLLPLFLLVACSDKTNELKNGVMYAKNALEQAGANPFSRATYQSVIGRGGNAADYVKATLPQEDPPFDSFEYEKPTHPWTVVIRPGTDEGEFFVEGYGMDVKKPMVFESVQVTMPEE
jgi:hypothetical protein